MWVSEPSWKHPCLSKQLGKAEKVSRFFFLKGTWWRTLAKRWMELWGPKKVFFGLFCRCPKWLPSTLSQLCTSHAGKLRLMPLAKDLEALVNSQRTSASPDVRRWRRRACISKCSDGLSSVGVMHRAESSFEKCLTNDQDSHRLTRQHSESSKFACQNFVRLGGRVQRLWGCWK